MMFMNMNNLYTLNRIIQLATLLALIFVSHIAYSQDLQLITYAKKGDVDGVRMLLSDSIDVNIADGDGTTALHWAANRNDLDIADLLLRAEADVDAKNDLGATPLWLACTNIGNEMVIKLLDAGADPNSTLNTGESVLMNCARTGAADAVVALIEKGADINAREYKKGQTALMWAAAEGQSEVSHILVENGADVTMKSNGGFTPLMYTARSGDLESASAILDAGANPNEATEKFGSVLTLAVASKNEQLGLFLLTMGADPEIADENGITPLHYTVSNGISALHGVRYDNIYNVYPKNMYKLAKALLEAGADPNMQIARNHRIGPDGSPFEMKGATPLLLAAVSADVPLMQLLHAHGADADIKADGGITLLIAAARSACTGSCAFEGGNDSRPSDIEKSFHAVKAVVEMGVDINATADDGKTAIHMAAFTGADPVVQYLADQGANINVRDKYGETPWTMASGISPVLRYRGLYGTHESTAKLLLELGATYASRDQMDDKAPPPPGQ